jgi:hypothetical protein
MGNPYWTYDDDGTEVPFDETPDAIQQVAATYIPDEAEITGVDDYGFPLCPGWSSVIDCDEAIEAAADAALDADADAWNARMTGQDRI